MYPNFFQTFDKIFRFFTNYEFFKLADLFPNTEFVTLLIANSRPDYGSQGPRDVEANYKINPTSNYIIHSTPTTITFEGTINHGSPPSCLLSLPPLHRPLPSSPSISVVVVILHRSPNPPKTTRLRVPIDRSSPPRHDSPVVLRRELPIPKYPWPRLHPIDDLPQTVTERSGSLGEADERPDQGGVRRGRVRHRGIEDGVGEGG